MKVRLQVQLSAKSTYVWEHGGTVIRIGRNPDCELPITGDAGQTVSWEHAQLELGPAGLLLRDLRSSNGTYLNGRVITHQEKLRCGDEIGLGQTGPRMQVMDISLGDRPLPPPGNNATLPEKVVPPPVAVVVAPVQAAVMAGPAPVPQPSPLPVRVGPPAQLAGAIRPAAADDSLSNHPASTTRLILKALQNRHRRLGLYIAMAVLVGVALGVTAFVILRAQAKETARLADLKAKEADEKIAQAKEEAHLAGLKAKEADEKAKKADAEAKRHRDHEITGQEVYKRTLRSTAFVAVQLNNGTQGNGSGSLVDKKRRLVLTAYHVVDKAAAVAVMFPQYAEGQVISDRGQYNTRQPGVLIKGKVIASNAQSDLALIQLESVPADVKELPLADTSSTPGSRVHTVGNPAASAGLWAYTVGAVRQVAQRKYIFASKQAIDALVVETQNPINRGDSGGPVVNDRIELVAVNSGVGPNFREGTLCIDVREVKALLVSVP